MGEHCEDAWNDTIAIHLTAPFLLVKTALPAMKAKGWGRIIMMSSVLGKVAVPNLAAYTAAKHGIIGLSKTVALESATSGVTCNCICPGFVKTQIIKLPDVMAQNGWTEEEAE